MKYKLRHRGRREHEIRIRVRDDGYEEAREREKDEERSLREENYTGALENAPLECYYQ